MLSGQRASKEQLLIIPFFAIFAVKWCKHDPVIWLISLTLLVHSDLRIVFCLIFMFHYDWNIVLTSWVYTSHMRVSACRDGSHGSKQNNCAMVEQRHLSRVNWQKCFWKRRDITSLLVDMRTAGFENCHRSMFLFCHSIRYYSLPLYCNTVSPGDHFGSAMSVDKGAHAVNVMGKTWK